MNKKESRYVFVDISNFIVYDKFLREDIKCYETRKCVDELGREYSPKFLNKKLWNKEFIIWVLQFTAISKRINFKNDYCAFKFSKYIYAPTFLLDKDIQFELINANYEYINKIPNELLSDELIDYALKKNARALASIPQERRKKERCEYAVRKNGLNLMFVPDNFKTVSMCISATVNNPHVIKYVPNRILNQEFFDIIKKLGVKIKDDDYNYIYNSIRIHKILNVNATENLSKESIKMYNNITLDYLTDFFSPQTLKLLRKLNIITLNDFFSRICQSDFIFLLGTNQNVINEIYASNRLLRCKYLNENPNIDIDDDFITLKDTCDLLGLNASVYNSLASYTKIYSSKSFFDFMKNNSARSYLGTVKNLGDVNIDRIVTRANVVLDFYKSYEKNKIKKIYN